MDGEQFEKRREAWQLRALRDSELSPLARLVAVRIALMINRETNETFPTQETLARELGVTIRGVQKALDTLVLRRHLDRRPGPNRRKANRYRFVEIGTNGGSSQTDSEANDSPSRNEAEANACSLQTPADDTNPRSSQSTGDTNGGSSQNDFGTNTGSYEHPFASRTAVPFGTNSRSDLGRTGVRTVPLNNTPECTPESYSADDDLFEAPGEKRSPKPRFDADRAFNSWWQHVPRKVAKDAARKAYDQVLKSKRATPDELMAGIMRYAHERTGQDPQYTKHPKTWLTNGCWADEPAPAPTTAPAARQSFGNQDSLDPTIAAALRAGDLL